MRQPQPQQQHRLSDDESWVQDVLQSKDGDSAEVLEILRQPQPQQQHRLSDDESWMQDVLQCKDFDSAEILRLLRHPQPQPQQKLQQQQQQSHLSDDQCWTQDEQQQQQPHQMKLPSTEIMHGDQNWWQNVLNVEDEIPKEVLQESGDGSNSSGSQTTGGNGAVMDGSSISLSSGAKADSHGGSIGSKSKKEENNDPSGVVDNRYSDKIKKQHHYQHPHQRSSIAKQDTRGPVPTDDIFADFALGLGGNIESRSKKGDYNAPSGVGNNLYSEKITKEQQYQRSHQRSSIVKQDTRGPVPTDDMFADFALSHVSDEDEITSANVSNISAGNESSGSQHNSDGHNAQELGGSIEKSVNNTMDNADYDDDKLFLAQQNGKCSDRDILSYFLPELKLTKRHSNVDQQAVENISVSDDITNNERESEEERSSGSDAISNMLKLEQVVDNISVSDDITNNERESEEERSFESDAISNMPKAEQAMDNLRVSDDVMNDEQGYEEEKISVSDAISNMPQDEMHQLQKELLAQAGPDGIIPKDLLKAMGLPEDFLQKNLSRSNRINSINSSGVTKTPPVRNDGIDEQVMNKNIDDIRDDQISEQETSSGSEISQMSNDEMNQLQEELLAQAPNGVSKDLLKAMGLPEDFLLKKGKGENGSSSSIRRAESDVSADSSASDRDRKLRNLHLRQHRHAHFDPKQLSGNIGRAMEDTKANNVGPGVSKTSNVTDSWSIEPDTKSSVASGNGNNGEGDSVGKIQKSTSYVEQDTRGPIPNTEFMESSFSLNLSFQSNEGGNSSNTDSKSNVVRDSRGPIPNNEFNEFLESSFSLLSDGKGKSSAGEYGSGSRGKNSSADSRHNRGVSDSDLDSEDGAAVFRQKSLKSNGLSHPFASEEDELRSPLHSQTFQQFSSAQTVSTGSVYIDRTKPNLGFMSRVHPKNRSPTPKYPGDARPATLPPNEDNDALAAAMEMRMEMIEAMRGKKSERETEKKKRHHHHHHHHGHHHHHDRRH